MAHGFVYFLENPSMRGLVKIGHTERHPVERARQLSTSTSCPNPFTVLAYFGHSHPQWAETQIHSLLEEHRVNDRREFFSLPYYKLQDVMRQYGDPAVDAFFSTILDQKTAEEARQLDAAMEAL